jgi:hypothetical protein
MDSRHGGSTLLAAGLLLSGLMAAGCTGSGPADWVLSSSSPSGPSAAPSASSPATPTAGPSATATPTATVTASPSQGASPTPTVAPPGTALGPDGCTGSADNKEFFKEAAHALSFPLYCAVLSSSWWLQDGAYRQPGGGDMFVYYRTSSGATVKLWEGTAACTDSSLLSMPPCSPSGTPAGSASFGGMPGTLYVQPDGSHWLWAGVGQSYVASGTGMSQDTFVSITAALTGIVKS